MAVMKCTAAGDSIILRRLPGDYEGLAELRQFIARGDLRFTNLETTVHRFEAYGAAQSGGSWICTQPEMLEDIKSFGFNTVSAANNHTMDFCHVGVLKTLEYVKASGLHTCGTGLNLAEASAPTYLDTLSGRYAAIGASSSFKPDAKAGDQSGIMPGRPGLNGISLKAKYYVTADAMKLLQTIADETGINAAYNIDKKDGYYPEDPEGTMTFGTYKFVQSDKMGKVVTINENDMKRMEKSIREAKFMSDYVVIAMHAHHLAGHSAETPAPFLEEFAHRCIDAGADAIIGTGPHLLRAIEIYKGCPIFYSLGNFIFQIENLQRVPADMYEGQGMTGTEGIDALLNKRSANGTRGLYYRKPMFQTVIPYWESENGKLTKLELMPAELGFGLPRSVGGWPRPCYDDGIIEHLAELSAPYGTKMHVENGIGVVEL